MVVEHNTIKKNYTRMWALSENRRRKKKKRLQPIWIVKAKTSKHQLRSFVLCCIFVCLQVIEFFSFSRLLNCCWYTHIAKAQNFVWNKKNQIFCSIYLNTNRSTSVVKCIEFDSTTFFRSLLSKYTHMIYWFDRVCYGMLCVRGDRTVLFWYIFIWWSSIARKTIEIHGISCRKGKRRSNDKSRLRRQKIINFV